MFQTWQPTCFLLSDKTRIVCVCGRVDTRVWLGTSHTRTNQQQAVGEPSPAEGPEDPSQNRPSPALNTPHTDEFDSLEPEPSRTCEPDSACMGTLRMGFLPRRALKTGDDEANPVLMLCQHILL